MIATVIKPNGFCNGVKRAIKIINNILTNESLPQPIYMLGYLVHNKFVISSYENKIKVITSDYEDFLNNTFSGTVIFTAHGVSPKLYDIAVKNNLFIIDTTCVMVKKIQDSIKNKIESNYDVYVVGHKNHPEVLSYLGISDSVKLYTDELKPLLYKNNNKKFICNQTTLIYDDVYKIYKDVKKENPNIEIIDSVCNATVTRQKAILDNINNFDLFIIIGDPLSNNCESLYQLVIKNNKDAIKIENVDELNDYDILKYQSIGITAGASTPKAIVDETVYQINNYGKKIFKFKSNLQKKDYIEIN